jgi:putative peptidoglycan lipid II flippase
MSAISQLDDASPAGLHVHDLPALPRRGFLAGICVVAGGTLASRVLGLARDMATASLLGLSSGVLDALIVAFRIPNLARALLGEGALATCYVPHLAGQRRQGAAAAWRAATALFFWLAVVLTALVVAGETLCGLLWLASEEPRTRLLLGLSAILLPYMLLVCLAAQVAATLQTFSRFTVSAAAPALLNVVWLVAAWWVAPSVSRDAAVQAHVLAGAILIAGVLQLAVQLPVLWRLGFRPRLSWQAGRQTLGAMLPALCPTMLALAVTRINTLCDSLLAWMLAGPTTGEPIGWLGGTLRYPLEQGAAGAIYCAERLCHFPVGLLGLSIATVVFPQLSRQAAGGEARAFAAGLTYGLRLVLLLGIPASAGLWLLAEPLAALLFQHGEFTADDALRTAALVRAYALGVWASCALPVLLRASYALGDRRTPLRIGVAIVAINLAMNLLLVWPRGETALAFSTSLCAALQCLLLARAVFEKLEPGAWRDLVGISLRAIAATAVMCLAGKCVLGLWEGPAGPGRHLAQVGLALGVCLSVYALLLWRWEQGWLSRRG